MTDPLMRYLYLKLLKHLSPRKFKKKIKLQYEWFLKRTSFRLIIQYIQYKIYSTYNVLNSSNKRACSNTFVHVTLVSSTQNSGQKLQESVKSDTRKLLKRLKNNLKIKKQHTQNKNTLVLKT